MNKHLFQTFLISSYLVGFSLIAYAQNNFDEWGDIGSFDSNTTNSNAESSPKLPIPNPNEIKKEAEIKNKIDTQLKVDAPKNVPAVNVPTPPEAPQKPQVIAEEQKEEPIIAEKPKAKKSKAKPVEIKNKAQTKASWEQTKRAPSDKHISSSLSSIFQENQNLEGSFKPDNTLTRKKFENKAIQPKFFQRAEFDENNKHLPTVVYQKQYSELLFAAIQKDDVGAISTLIKNGADLNSVLTENGYSALMYAIQTNHLRTVRYLITKGVNVNTQAKDGKTALHIAATNNNVEIFTSLIKSGAKAFTTDYIGKYPVDYASSALRGQFETIVAEAEPDKNNAIFSFVQKGSTQPVAKLIEEGADINIRDKNGDTPLMIAVRNNDSRMANLLLGKGASPLPMNNTGEHALGIAQKNGNIELATIIDTITIRKELESGIARRITQPTKAPIQKLQPVAEHKNNPTLAKEESKTELVKPEPSNKQATFITVVEEEPKNDDGFFSSMSKSISSISGRVFGTSLDTDTGIKTTTNPEVISEKLPELKKASSPQMTIETDAKKTKLPPNIVKKKLIDGKELAKELDSANNADSAISTEVMN